MRMLQWKICILVLLSIGLFSTRCFGRNQGEVVQDPVKFKQLQTDMAKFDSLDFLGGIPGIVSSILLELLSMAWDYFSPDILNNKINDVYDKMSDLEQELVWLEYAIFYEEDIKTLTYLIRSYKEDIQNSTGSEAAAWADVALSFDSNGFDKSLKDIGDMMEGTGSLFVKDSIFEVVGSKADLSEDNAKTCITIQQTWDYLTGLWITGHAVWAQAFRIKNDSFQYNAAQKKRKAESKLEAFRAERDKSFLKRCYYERCYKPGWFYRWEGAEDTLKNIPTAEACNDACMTDKNCTVWTSHLEKKECFKFDAPNDATKSNDSSIISGPKICPKCQPACNAVYCSLHFCGDASCCRAGGSTVGPNLLLSVIIFMCYYYLN